MHVDTHKRIINVNIIENIKANVRFKYNLRHQKSQIEFVDGLFCFAIL